MSSGDAAGNEDTEVVAAREAYVKQQQRPRQLLQPLKQRKKGRQTIMMMRRQPRASRSDEGTAATAGDSAGDETSRGSGGAARGDHPAPRRESSAARGDHPAARRESSAARGDHPAARRESSAARGDHPAARRESSAARGDHPAARKESSAARGDHPAYTSASDAAAAAGDNALPLVAPRIFRGGLGFGCIDSSGGDALADPLVNDESPQQRQTHSSSARTRLSLEVDEAEAVVQMLKDTIRALTLVGGKGHGRELGSRCAERKGEGGRS